MNATELFLLGRRLMLIAERALPRSELATSARLVLVDIAYHPGSSISQITERTGFPQSLVSLSVARLRELDMVETAQDPADRRRTLVRPRARMIARAQQGIGARSVQDAVAEALAEDGGADDAADVADMVAALDQLALRLLPEVGPDSAWARDAAPAADQNSGS